jgi:D-arabinose 1-dehydrogenase-like Zn-dependent alcohol dehydrogenase
MTNSVAGATMRAAQVTAAGAGLRIVNLETPDFGRGKQRIRVRACGVCYSTRSLPKAADQESPIREFQDMK